MGYVRSLDLFVALVASLMCVVSLTAEFSSLDLSNILKALATSGLLFASALSPWRLSARVVAALLFVSFAAYNVVGVMVGRTDCGCFPIQISPLLTGLIDVGCALWLGWRSWGIASLRWSFAMVVLSMVIGVVCSVYLPVSQVSPTLSAVQRMAVGHVSSSLPGIGEQILPAHKLETSKSRTILIHRSSCPRCHAEFMRLRLIQSPMLMNRQPDLQVELDEGQITTLDGSLTTDAEALRPLLSRARFWPVPILITVVDGTVVGVEDRSAQH